MEQKNIDQLLKVIADGLVGIDSNRQTGETIGLLKDWMNFYAPEYWNYSKEPPNNSLVPPEGIEPPSPRS